MMESNLPINQVAVPFSKKVADSLIAVFTVLSLIIQYTMTFSSRFLFLLSASMVSLHVSAQRVDDIPKKSDPLHLRVEKLDKLMMGNHWNEGAFLQQVFFPPAGLDEPIIGQYGDCLDVTTEMLAAYSYKYAITKDPEDRKIADQIFEAVATMEKVTGVPGLMARGFYKSDKPLWHETLWYPEWHNSTTMPGYRWLGDLSSDKFTSIFYGVGTYWEFCADEVQKQKAADLLDRFVGRVIDDNFKLTDLDGKMTLWGNFCPNLPHQKLNSLKVLAGLKVTYHITGKERFNAAYHMLIDEFHYDDHVVDAKILFPKEWRQVGDDYHAARSLYFLMRLETDKDLLIKYKMSLNRHWYDWKDWAYSWPSNIWDVMVYQVLTGEEVFNDERTQVVKDMWEFDRGTREFKIPQQDGSIKSVKAGFERSSGAMIRNYWFGRYYNIIDPSW